MPTARGLSTRMAAAERLKTLYGSALSTPSDDRDMIAVRVSRPFRWLVAASPDYLARRGRPEVPEDIARHDCIRFRLARSRRIYRWEFERPGPDGTAQALSVDPPGDIVTNDTKLVRTFALQGLGLVYGSELMLGAFSLSSLVV